MHQIVTNFNPAETLMQTLVNCLDAQTSHLLSVQFSDIWESILWVQTE